VRAWFKQANFFFPSENRQTRKYLAHDLYGRSHLLGLGPLKPNSDPGITLGKKNPFDLLQILSAKYNLLPSIEKRFFTYPNF